MKNVTVLLVLLATVGALAGEAGFLQKPAVTRAGAGARIAFAVSAPTDVEVAVVDASNRVVRHLAAGVLGVTNSPPPPLKAHLKAGSARSRRGHEADEDASPIPSPQPPDPKSLLKAGCPHPALRAPLES